MREKELTIYIAVQVLIFRQLENWKAYWRCQHPLCPLCFANQDLLVEWYCLGHKRNYWQNLNAYSLFQGVSHSHHILSLTDESRKSSI